MAHRRVVEQAVVDATREVQNCKAICIDTIQHCLQMGGAHVEPSHMQIMQDCADICETAGRFYLRGSAQHRQVTVSCIELCNLCAASCEKIKGDAQMKDCADACRLCAAACQRLVPETQAGGGLGQAPRGAR